MTTTTDAPRERPFTVLFVCTANLCRSPLAENLFRASLGRLGLDWEAASAGLRARDGLPMHPHAAEVLLERGVSTEGWASRRLSVSRIAAADLVLTAEVAHRQAVVTVAPAAVRYSFTLLQFSQLLSLGPAEAGPGGQQAGPDLIRYAELARSRPQNRDSHLLELSDPIGKPIEAFRATADRITEALREIEEALGQRSADAAALWM
jgi:protein-tyrosine phosphatase